MNSYGRLAQERTREYRPAAYAALEDPEGFFTTVGQEMADRIPGLRDGILGGQREGENLEEYHLRGLQAHRTAEELAVFDHWLMQAPPEDEGDVIDAWLNRPDDEEDDDGGVWIEADDVEEPEGQLVLFDLGG